ncbi:THUMP domain protein, partial [mine drainage metagenome]
MRSGSRRTGSHSFTSQELARDLGSAVLARFADRGISVDLESPTVELFVEVRSNRAYLSEDRMTGARRSPDSGSPVGSWPWSTASGGRVGAYLL